MAISGQMDGIKVVDLTSNLAGPMCTTLLADMGAEVVKIEMPGTGDVFRRGLRPLIDEDTSYVFFNVNRNKKSIALDLKHESGRKVVSKLIETADVFVENYRPGVMRKLGLDYDAANELNPRLVYCSISGYGQSGPLCNRPAYDIVVQAESGMMTVIGMPGGPPVLAPPGIVDFVTGVFGALAIASALFNRRQTGVGERIDVALFDVALFLLSHYGIPEYFGLGRAASARGSKHPYLVPYETHDCSDGRQVMVAAITNKLFGDLCVALGMEKLAEDAKFATESARITNKDELIGILDKVFATKTRDEWIEILNRAEVPCGAVNTTAEAFQRPQVSDREMVLNIKHRTKGEVKIMGNPMKFSHGPVRMVCPAPALGQDSESILTDIGYSPDMIDELKSKRVI